MTELTRRAALGAAALLPFAGATATGLLTAAPAQAAAPMQEGAGRPPYNRFKLGEFEVTALMAGTRAVPEPHKIFGLTTPDDTFEAVSKGAFLPSDVAQFFFTPTLVNTGKELVLFDTGVAPDGIVAALAAAGYKPEQVDLVVITHMHGDHIGGLMADGTPTFPNARYATGRKEYDHWAAAGNKLFDSNMKPLAEKTTFLEDGKDAAPGMTAVLAAGHTPGHMAYHLDSGGKSLMLIADTANHYVWSLAYPDWEVKFDADKAMAAKTRHKLLGQIAADRIPFIGYHMPFPALGYVETAKGGDATFHYVPASYQMMLGA